MAGVRADALSMGEVVAADQALPISPTHSSNEALRYENEQLRAIVNLNAAVAWITDAAGSFEQRQPSWESYTGQGWPEHAGWGWLEMLHPDDRERARVLWERAIEELRAYESEGRVWHAASGRYRHIVARAIPLLEPDGSVREWVGTIVDLDDRKRGEVERARLAALVESSDDAIIGKTLDGTITSWNPGAQRLYGYTPEEVIGRPISLLIPDDHPDELPGIMSRLRRGQRIDHFETERITQDGRRLDISVTISPIRDGSGTIVGASSIARDITARKQAERERTELLERERAARSEAEAALRARDQFLSIASHELRTPVTTVKAAAQLLLRAQAQGRLQPEQLGRLLERIDQTGSHLGELIDDLLDVSCLQSGQMPLRLERLDLAKYVRATVEHLAEQIGDRHRVVLEEATPAQVEADAGRIEQVLTNLLDNAAKYSPDGGEVRVRVRTADGGAIVEVRDRGIGLPPGAAERIFEPFGRARNATVRQVPGLGLGLYICRMIVERHGGRIWAHSEGEGRGATMGFWLPLAD